MQDAVTNENILLGDSGLFKLAVAEAADFCFFGPDFGIEPRREVVFIKKAVFLVHNAPQSVPNKETS